MRVGGLLSLNQVYWLYNDFVNRKFFRWCVTTDTCCLNMSRSGTLVGLNFCLLVIVVWNVSEGVPSFTFF